MTRLAALAFAALLLPGAAASDPVAGLDACMAQAWESRDCMGTVSGPCIEARGEATATLVECIGAETEAWDRLLNLTYGAVMAEARGMDATGDVLAADLTREATLRQAQRAWIAFRDAECTMQRARWGRGSLGRVSHANCLMVETAERTITLMSLREP